MGKLSLVVSMLIICCWAVEIYGADDADTETAWETYQIKFPVKAENNKELAMRKSLFVQTHAKIAKHNSDKDATFKMGHNKFSAMTEQEKRAYAGAKLPVPPVNVTWAASSRQVATSLDYRTNYCMSPIRNQGGCGSCWAFSATAVTEFQKCRKNGQIRVDLSEQQLVDCVSYNNCAGGLEQNAWQYLAANGGQTYESYYPYTATNGFCRFRTGDVAAAKISSVSPVQWIAPGDTYTMMSILTAGRLVSVHIMLPLSFYNYASGIFGDTACDNLNGHAVPVVGYGTLNGINYWVIRNSWSPYWGMGGYGFIKRGNNLCSIESAATTTNVI